VEEKEPPTYVDCCWKFVDSDGEDCFGV